MFGKDNTNFIRVIGNQRFIIRNGEIIFKSTEKSCKFISKLLLNRGIINVINII